MNLNELLTEHPSAKVEHTALLAAEYQEGVDATEAVVKARVEKASKILESEYPTPLKALACKVITGEEPASALTGAVTSFDITMEAEKARIAAEETDKSKETPAGGVDAKSEDGVIRNPADLKAENDRLNPGKEDK